jgi:hypothetical protein
MTYAAKTFDPKLHRDALLAIWSENMSDRSIALVTERRFSWMYESGESLTWLGVHVEEDTVIGCGSLVPRDMWVGGEKLSSGILCDFAVTKAHRIAGAAIAIQRAISSGSQSAGMKFIFGFPNKQSAAVCTRVGYKSIAKIKAFVKPLRSAYKLKERFKSPLALIPASFAVDVGLAARDLVTFAPRLETFATEVIDRADARFDDLASRVGAQFIVGEKGSRFLNWRYADFTTKKHQFFVLKERSGEQRVIGYVVFHVASNKVFVDDLFCDFAVDLDRLLFGFSWRMRSAGYDSIMVAYAGTDALGEALVRNHFIARPSDDRPLVVYVPKGAPPAFSEAVLDGNRWLMMDGELDL